MTKLPFIAIAAAAALVGCQSDTRALEKKIDDLSKKIDDLAKHGGAGAAQQRPARPQADPAKTYAVSVEGDPFEGPADAKVTLVKAYDYACPYCQRVGDTM